MWIRERERERTWEAVEGGVTCEKAVVICDLRGESWQIFRVGGRRWARVVGSFPRGEGESIDA